MTRLYLAGPYSADNVLDVLANIRQGIHAATEALQAGFAVFCPWLDFQFGVVADIPLEYYREHSLAWLRASDVMWLLPGWEGHEGVIEELSVASELGIPVFDTLEQCMEWDRSRNVYL